MDHAVLPFQAMWHGVLFKWLFLTCHGGLPCCAVDWKSNILTEVTLTNALMMCSYKRDMAHNLLLCCIKESNMDIARFPKLQLICHMGSHCVTCHLADVTFLPVPQQAGTWFSDPAGMQGWVGLVLYCRSVVCWCLRCFDAVGWAAGRASGL